MRTQAVILGDGILRRFDGLGATSPKVDNLGTGLSSAATQYVLLKFAVIETVIVSSCTYGGLLSFQQSQLHPEVVAVMTVVSTNTSFGNE